MAQLAFSEDLNSILQINTCKANNQLRNNLKIFSQFSKKMYIVGKMTKSISTWSIVNRFRFADGKNDSSVPVG